MRRGTIALFALPTERPPPNMPSLTPDPADMMDSHLITARDHFQAKRTDEGLLCLTLALQSLHERLIRLEDELLPDIDDAS